MLKDSRNPRLLIKRHDTHTHSLTERERERERERGRERGMRPYRECLRNHAASLGSYATDGCSKFTSDDCSPSSLQCVACGCHCNFHRKVTYTVAHAGGKELMVCQPS
ncbi:hypothetical protein NL676_007140, partial [Syzygium grande]